ncbi:hypothetical protein Bca4012_018188 [Brassica carinata]
MTFSSNKISCTIPFFQDMTNNHSSKELKLNKPTTTHHNECRARRKRTEADISSRWRILQKQADRRQATPILREPTLSTSGPPQMDPKLTETGSKQNHLLEWRHIRRPEKNTILKLHKHPLLHTDLYEGHRV